MTPLSGAINTNLPTIEQLFEIGGSWAPLSNLLFSARAEIQSMWQKSHLRQWRRRAITRSSSRPGTPPRRSGRSRPVTVTSRTGSIRTSRWDIAVLDEPPPAETLRMGFKGQTQVVNVGGRYAWSEKLTLTAGLFFTDGLNVFKVPAVPDRCKLVDHARVLERAGPVRQVSGRLRLQVQPEDLRAISASTSSTIRTSRKGSVREPRSSSWAGCPHHSEVESDGPIRNPIQAKCRSPFHVFPKAVYPPRPPKPPESAPRSLVVAVRPRRSSTLSSVAGGCTGCGRRRGRGRLEARLAQVGRDRQGWTGCPLLRNSLRTCRSRAGA